MNGKSLMVLRGEIKTLPMRWRLNMKMEKRRRLGAAGWKETTVLVRFWILSIIFALLGMATLKLR